MDRMAYYDRNGWLWTKTPPLPRNFTLEDAMEAAAAAEEEVEAAKEEVVAADMRHATSGWHNPWTENKLNDAKERLKDAEADLKYIIQKSGGRRYKSKRHKRTSKRHKRTSKRHKK